MTDRANDHRALRVWQKATDLTMAAYDMSEAFPRREVYGLAGQLRRAAVSVPSNIAEGNGRGHRADYARFLSMARGPLREVHTLAEVARRRAYLTDQQCGHLNDLLDQVGKMLTRMIKRLSNRE